ncbi:hypothetical protein O3M35_007368 [Rhynocoris fuscipes]|uniref:Lipid storage droplets surface-binding protein 1 n=1 Tax=Rhynocoris fuscipes TaxID=488301 RepID=A0AAW1DAK8_9HEMI
MSTTIKREIPQLESINRISKIPVVETGMNYAKFMYGKIKNSNSLFQWGFVTVEGGIQTAIDKTLIAAPIIEMPLNIVDSLMCKSLDTIEHRVPAINYPPEQLLNMTKQLVTTRIVQPVVKRADSVKQLSVQEASKYGEIAASRIDSALDVADLYVDKFLPDASDSTDSKIDSKPGESKTIQTIEHVNRLSRKLQRRLTRRTLEEARALRKQGADTVQVLLHLLDLAIRDPKQFVEKMKTVWNHLSQDEPENQIPPANLEQLIAMLTRESARRFVHLTNFTIETAANLPTYTRQTIHWLNIYTSYMLDYLNKTVNFEQVKDTAVAKVTAEINVLQDMLRQLNSLFPLLMERLLSPKKAIKSPASQSENTQNSSQQTLKENGQTSSNQCKDDNNKNTEQHKDKEVHSVKKNQSKKKKSPKKVPSDAEDENFNEQQATTNDTTIENNSTVS